MKIALFRPLLAGLTLLAGCSVGPDFLAPESGLPDRALVADARLAASPDPQWWGRFHDRTLTELETQVAALNLDVQTATLKLAESRFQRGIAAAAQLPTLNGDAKSTREQYSKNGVLSLLGGLAPGGQIAVPPITETFVGFDASWELDLWGHVRRQVESADAQIEAVADQRRDALVSALAEVARDYIQLRGVQTQIGIAQDNLKIAEQVLQLAEERERKGLQSGLDTQNASAQIESLRAQIPALQQQESELVNALSYLLDQPPGALRAKLGTSRRSLLAASAPLGVASELARRRPDVRAAEAQLHAATADTGVAVAAFYPTVQLNGNVGFDALDVNKLWQASSLQYNFGPSLSLPVFNGGRLQNMLELRKAQQQEAAIVYHKTVLRAWHDVVNALAAIRFERERQGRLVAQLSHARQARAIARARYADGVTEFLPVLDAERTALLAEQQLAQSATNLALNQTQLFKALGGGWEETFPQLAQAAN